MHTPSETVVSRSVEDTRSFGARVARSARAGDVFALVGEIGTGKTEFVRGFVAQACRAAAVRSPTFSILNIHEATEFSVYHFDLYRLRKREELVEIGFYEYVGGDGIVLIEWADLFAAELPAGATWICFADTGDGARKISRV